jgi:group I intron endonuclease
MKSGIYKITILNNIYIGSSSNLARRLWEHEWRLKNNKHNNNHLQNVYNKYNIENFITEILEYCKLEVLLEREQYYIDLLNPNLNKAPVSGTTLGLKLTKEQCLTRKLNNLGRKHSKESIEQRVSKIKGRKYSEEHRKNISNSKKGKSLSKEHKEKLINGNKKSVGCYNQDGVLIKIYTCAKEALSDGYTPTNVTRCCKNKLRTHKKLIWKYYDK